MKTKTIESVQNVFKNILLSGNFEVENFDTNYLTVYIHDKYKFYLWTGNGSGYCRPWENGVGDYFMKLPEFTNEERLKLWKICETLIKENSESIRLSKIEQITKELEVLKSFDI